MKILKLSLAAASIMVTLCITSLAQERGQYLPGFRGLNSSEQPPPGVTYANYFFWYPANELKNRNGSTSSVSLGLDLMADMNLLAYTPKKKFLGATYTASVAIPIQNIAVSLPTIGAGLKTGGGLGDIYIEPLSLGWKLKHGKVRTGYGFIAPTGRYNVGAADNLSTDFWGHQFAVGGTYNPDKMGLWQINASSVWEAHHTKRHEDVKVGNNVTLEYAVGRTFVKNDGKQFI
ncbi:MAG TPA: transporter, partial [Pyrinomonadaceae bacterium]|nr:transporter [Pyrinomonadaceae bacterium]